MHVVRRIAMALVIWAPSFVPVADAQTGQAAPNASPAAANAAAPAVAEPADRLLKQMGAYIGSAEQFTFHADITFDHVLPSGQKLQFTASEDVALQRPGRLYVRMERRSRRPAVLVRRHVDHAVRSVDTILLERGGAAGDRRHAGQAGDAARTSPRRSPTFSIATPTTACMVTCSTGSISGLNDVNGRSCRALAFVEKDIDWQIWIDDRTATDSRASW